MSAEDGTICFIPVKMVGLFDQIKNRNVMDTEHELKDADREIFDRKILKAIGHEELYDAIKESLLSMQYARHSVTLQLNTK